MAEAAKAAQATSSCAGTRFEAARGERPRDGQADAGRAGVRSLQDPEFTVSLKLAPPKVNVPEPEKLADEFVRVPSPDHPISR
jgi:hypothetical protein